MRLKSSLYRVWVSLLIIIGALACMFPMRDRPFEQYIQSCVTHDREGFAHIMEQAQKKVHSCESKSLFLAIQEVASQESKDLSRSFRQLNVADIKNTDKKNRVLLEALLARSKSKLKQGLDLKGGISCTLSVDDPKFDQLAPHEKTEQLNKAMDIIRQRIDGLGVSEPIIRVMGSNSIEVQLAGVSTKDNPELVNVIKKPAKLEFRLLHPTLRPHTAQDRPPVGYEVLAMEEGDQNIGPVYEFVKKIPEMGGGMVKRAAVGYGQYGDYEIGLQMTEEGTKRFEKVTRENIDRRLGIVLDGKLYSAPCIRVAIPNGRASITGRFSQREALELANILNNPLEVELKFVELSEIGPSLADDAKASALRASVVGIGVIVLFLVGYYGRAGWLSLLSLLTNVIIVLGMMVTLGTTLTLPGIAALVLTIGMAIDANILIFERIREELLQGHPLETAFRIGHDKAFTTILDSNLTTLLTAIILTYFGTGPIRGFGTILAIGILATMFTALVMNRGILEIFIYKGWTKKLLPDFHFHPRLIPFMSYRKVAFAAYGVIFLVALVAMTMGHHRVYGIDFTGGDEVSAKFDQKIAIHDIYQVAADHGLQDVHAVYQKSLSNDSEILRLQTVIGGGETLFEALKTSYPESNLSLVKKTEIGATVGENIKMNALMSVCLSMIGIMVYVAFRFEMGYGIGAVISTTLNVIVTLLIYLAMGHQISAPMVASILMVVGYSINDTIIVFDRIREELRLDKQKSLYDIINQSITHTLSRTILTSSTTFLSALALYLFGSGVIVDFVLVFMLGVAIGTCSSIFIASPLFYLWHKGDRRKVVGA